ncbi:hypothetical protein BD779DRAFT_1796471 [Infundibulicybe gibba]|nr:hypothetical protein BD779DRAFT_1796471 [Infundibulicybe gibba]
MLTSVPPPSSSGSHNIPPGSTAIPTNKKTLPIILKTQDDIQQFEKKITVWAQSAPPNSYYDIPYTLCRIYKDKSAAVFILFRDDQGKVAGNPPPAVLAPRPVQAVVEQPPKPVQATVIREAKHANKKHLARDILRALGHATISLKRPRDETNTEPEAKRRALGDTPGKPKEDHIMQDVSRTDPHPSVPTTLDPVQPIQATQIEIASNSLPQDTSTPVSQTSANQRTPLPQVPTAGPPPMVIPITLLPTAPQPAVGHTSLVTDLSAQPGPSKPSDQTSRSTDSVVMNSPPSSVSKPSPLPQTAVSGVDPSSALAGPSKILSQQRTTKLTTTPPAPRSATSAQSIPPLSPPVQSDSSSGRDGNSEPHNPSSLHVSPEVTPPVSPSPSLRGVSVGPPKTPLFLPGSSASSPSRDPDTEDEAGPSIWVGRGSRTTSSSTSSHRSTPDFYVLVPPLPEYVKRHKAQLRGHKRSTPGSRAAPLAVEQIFRGVVCNDSAEEEAVRVVCTRLRGRRCKWAGCDVIMNSLGNLEHHLLQHGEANVAKSNYVQCQWQQCGRNIPYPQMSDHLRTHALSPLPCAYQGCDQSFRTPRQLLKHNQSVHGNDALMPSWLPSNHKPKSSPPMAPKSLPSWMVEARQVFQPIVSRERHAVLGPWVLRNISGPVGSGTRRYNAANPLPASQQSRESEEPQQPVYDDYEFLTNSSTTHSSAPSKASRNRRYEYLDSRTVSQYVNDGLVLWQNPEEDVDSTRGTPASMGEDELNLIAGSEIKTEANDSGSLHAPAENPVKEVLPLHHKSSDGLERPVLNEINQEAARQLNDAPLEIGRPTGNADVDEGAVEAMLVVS